MKYKDLITTLEIAAKYDGGLDHECFTMWAEHDEHGIEFVNTPSTDDLRKLAKMGWLLGSDAMYQQEDAELWENIDSLSDEQLVSLFERYNGIYKLE